VHAFEQQRPLSRDRLCSAARIHYENQNPAVMGLWGYGQMSCPFGSPARPCAPLWAAKGRSFNELQMAGADKVARLPFLVPEPSQFRTQRLL
jgi:hypothetical protein